MFTYFFTEVFHIFIILALIAECTRKFISNSRIKISEYGIFEWKEVTWSSLILKYCPKFTITINDCWHCARKVSFGFVEEITRC